MYPSSFSAATPTVWAIALTDQGGCNARIRPIRSGLPTAQPSRRPGMAKILVSESRTMTLGGRFPVKRSIPVDEIGERLVHDERRGRMGQRQGADFLRIADQPGRVVRAADEHQIFPSSTAASAGISRANPSSSFIGTDRTKSPAERAAAA